MKKLLYFAAAALMMVGTSCQKDEIGGTATEKLAGQWYVSVDGVDENGDVIEGYEGMLGSDLIINTYNTSANSDKVLFVDDLGEIWVFKVRTECDVNALTFHTANATFDEANPNNENGDPISVVISDGKILPGAGKQKNGSPADSITFLVKFSDDPYPATYGHAGYRVSGVRYSGLAEND